MKKTQYVVEVYVSLQKVRQIVTDSLEIAQSISNHIKDDVYDTSIVEATVYA
jgi:hypothetical protein